MSAAAGGLRERRTQTERTQQARDKVLEAAFACMAERGYHNTSLIDIARQAGVSRELPRYHFGSKEGLVSAMLAELARYWCNLFRDADGALIPFVAALARIGHMLDIDYAVMRGHAALLFGAAEPGGDALRPESLRGQKSIHAALQLVLARDLARRGVKLSRSEQQIYIAIIFSTFRGLLYQTAMGDDPRDIQLAWKQFCLLLPENIYVQENP